MQVALMFSDISSIAVWWLTIFVIGLINFPILWIIFNKKTSLAHGFARIFGIVLSGYVVFLLSTFHIVPFTRFTILATILFLGIVNFAIGKKYIREIKGGLKKNLRKVLIQEILFAFGLLLWSLVRGYAPEARGLEKFMDFGFVNVIANTKYLPPADMWAAGEIINYYWFGHYLTAFIAKLSAVTISKTYNLMLATIMGLTLSGTFSLTISLVRNFLPKHKRLLFIGIVSAILVTFGGNFHSTLYIAKDGIDNYWYPDATRFIGYNPDVDDKTIHEFPLYSFVVSDLHAHLIDLPIVLLFLGLVWSSLTSKRIFFNSGVLGLVLGIMFTVNAWDYPIYLMVAGFVYLIVNLAKNQSLPKTLLETIKPITTIIFFSVLAALPFLVNFRSIAQGIDFVNSRTPLWQLAVLWGFPFLLTIFFLYSFVKKRRLADYFVMGIFVSSWCLIFIPEIIYVKDIYIASHHRANTMFKLTYQAFVMFYLSSGFVFIRFINSFTKNARTVVSTLMFVLYSSLLIYPFVATKTYYADYKNYKGLNSETWIADIYPGYYGAIGWLRENSPTDSIILEAQGDSYTDYNLVSAYTGLPTIQGWFVHEWLWRGSSEFSQDRSQEVETIYTTSHAQTAKSLLDKYGVDYILVGKNEKEKYPQLNEVKFEQLGEVVFALEDTRLYKTN